jgi:hypothetical protein
MRAEDRGLKTNNGRMVPVHTDLEPAPENLEAINSTVMQLQKAWTRLFSDM